MRLINHFIFADAFVIHYNRHVHNHYVYVCIVWIFGEPHLKTLDGVEYTFNGKGEYYMMKTKNGIFTLQCRTKQPKTTNGVEPRGTVLAAIAAKNENSARMHVEVNSQTNGGLVYVINFV